MIVFFLLSQALCPLEDSIMELTSTTWHSPPVYRIMQGVSYAGHPVVSGTTPLVLYYAGEHAAAQDSYLGLFLNCATVIPMKHLIHRRRPCSSHVQWDASLPSGHTTFMFTQAYLLSHHYPKITVPVFAFASVVGLSRIYTQKHYPSDVLISVALGLLTGFVVTSF